MTQHDDSRPLPHEGRFFADPQGGEGVPARPERPDEIEVPDDPDEKLPDTIPGRIHGQLFSQPVSQPDSRYPATGVAMPSDENVAFNREWIQENEL